MILESVRRLRLLAKTVTKSKLDVVDLLEIDHMKVRALFFQIRTTASKKRQTQLWERARKDLEGHMHAEESVFYPACMKIEKLKSLALEAAEEHRQIRTLIRSMEGLSRDSEKWEPKLYLLMENVEHHVREEEAKIFPLVGRYFDYSEREIMGDELLAAKKDVGKAAA